jgi:hypothetical protein
MFILKKVVFIKRPFQVNFHLVEGISLAYGEGRRNQSLTIRTKETIGGSRIMRRVLMCILLVLVLSSYVYAVPYPYGDYDLPTNGDLQVIFNEVSQNYTVFSQTEDEHYPWFTLCGAEMQAPAVIDARINMRAEFQFWTEEEKEQARKEQFELFVDNALVVNLYLYSDPEVSRGYRYVDVEDRESQIDRIILETDKGKRYLSELAISIETELMGNNIWGSENIVVFPRYDYDNGSEIISKDTNWIKIWVIAGMNRIYFQFDFE